MEEKSREIFLDTGIEGKEYFSAFNAGINIL
jgi:hypothetical protein